MWENIWNDLQERNATILHTIDIYNTRICDGFYQEFERVLDSTIYLNIMVSHIANLLLDDEMLYLPHSVIATLNLQNSSMLSNLEWEEVGELQGFRLVASKEDILKRVKSDCFNDETYNFIQEICEHDILGTGQLNKEIYSILSNISIALIIDIKGEEEFLRQLSDVRNGKRRDSQIQRLYHKEYTCRGALIHNRVFKHRNCSGDNLSRVDYVKSGEGVLNYSADKMQCQVAVMHIGVAETGSSGTGFLISQDGYALTCAHVVEGVKELYANVIVGDGYFDDESEEFGIYDVGFGEVIYTNQELDIALLKTEYCGSHFLELEERQLLPEIGEEVVVFGYPLGFEMPQTNKFGPNISFYRGYVSSNQVKDGNSITFLDIDIKSGNSGSPVISVRTGRVIGIISGVKVGGKMSLVEKMPYMIPIQHFLELNKKTSRFNE